MLSIRWLHATRAALTTQMLPCARWQLSQRLPESRLVIVCTDRGTGLATARLLRIPGDVRLELTPSPIAHCRQKQHHALGHRAWTAAMSSDVTLLSLLSSTARLPTVSACAVHRECADIRAACRPAPLAVDLAVPARVQHRAISSYVVAGVIAGTMGAAPLVCAVEHSALGSEARHRRLHDRLGSPRRLVASLQILEKWAEYVAAYRALVRCCRWITRSRRCLWPGVGWLPCAWFTRCWPGPFHPAVPWTALR